MTCFLFHSCTISFVTMMKPILANLDGPGCLAVSSVSSDHSTANYVLVTLERLASMRSHLGSFPARQETISSFWPPAEQPRMHKRDKFTVRRRCCAHLVVRAAAQDFVNLSHGKERKGKNEQNKFCQGHCLILLEMARARKHIFRHIG